MQRPARGFTLIELMVALAIAALLLLLGMPSYTTFVRNSEIRSTSESIINGLRTATTEAANRNDWVTFTFAGGGDASWAINLVKDRTTGELVQPPIQKYSSKEAGNSAKTDSGGKLSVTFSGLGRVVNPGSPDHIQAICVYIGTFTKDCVSTDELHWLQVIVDDSNNPSPNKRRGLRMCDRKLDKLDPPDPRACE